MEGLILDTQVTNPHSKATCQVPGITQGFPVMGHLHRGAFAEGD